MPSLELAAGQVLTAAHTNTYWMRQAIAAGLSSSRPTGYEGRAVYDTDTDALMVYASPTTGWKPPWNLPWGHVASTALAGRAAAGGTASVGSLAFTAVANRRYRISAPASLLPVSPSTFEFRILVDGTAKGGGFAGTASSHFGTVAEAIVTGLAAGSRTIVLDTAVVSGGDVAVNPPASSTNIVLMVEDVGPSGAPA